MRIAVRGSLGVVGVDEAKAKAQLTYNAAADTFDEPALGFWDRFGAATVDRLDLPPGARVLDVCCGAGASAIPAARRVGPTGHVVGVDLADRLLDLAQAKADRLGLSWLELRHGDIDQIDEPPASYDAVVIVFGIFFLPDMTAALRRLWGLVAPGGQLAVTTWGPGLWEPASSVFWDAVATVRPDLHRAWHPWDTLTDPTAVTDLLAAAGTTSVRVEAVSGVHALPDPRDFWTIVTGSGYRATHDALSPTERNAVRDITLTTLDRDQVTSVRTDVIYAVATRST
jgi:ubiquinone/menaquinone biosynthesis C-methylase UbiE